MGRYRSKQGGEHFLCLVHTSYTEHIVHRKFIVHRKHIAHRTRIIHCLQAQYVEQRTHKTQIVQTIVGIELTGVPGPGIMFIFWLPIGLRADPRDLQPGENALCLGFNSLSSQHHRIPQFLQYPNIARILISATSQVSSSNVSTVSPNHMYMNSHFI